jgi:hypothetical protein
MENPRHIVAIHRGNVDIDVNWTAAAATGKKGLQPFIVLFL